MKRKAETTGWSRRYQAALRRYLEQGPGASLQPAPRLGHQAVALGLETLDLARLHQQAFTALVLPRDSSRTRQRLIKRAKSFFAETIVPIEKTHRAALKADTRVKQLTQTLCRRTSATSASTRDLEQGIAQRQAAEVALEKSTKQHAKLLQELRRLQDRLRHQTREILKSQENERQTTSRQLQDEIFQALLAINLRLLTLKTSSRINAKDLTKEIAKTRRLVRQSVRMIRQSAHELGSDHKA